MHLFRGVHTTTGNRAGKEVNDLPKDKRSLCDSVNIFTNGI